MNERQEISSTNSPVFEWIYYWSEGMTGLSKTNQALRADQELLITQHRREHQQNVIDT